MTDEDPEIAQARALVGHVLDDKWTLERLLGAGAMGAVYAAKHRNGARAAVKLLHPELARVADVRDRFLREGYAANRVEHRGAVQVLDDDVVKEGPDEGTAYLVMELLEGESLDERLERGDRPDERELLTILDEVLDVLAAAHEHGVVHRDLKPANLFLARAPDRPYAVKVLDFGLARLDERPNATRAGLAMGTPSFMSPEQASGRVDEIDGRTDLFAVGATAFRAVSGRNVHEAPGLLQLVVRMGTMPAPKLRDVTPGVSSELAAIVDRALEFRRDDRYPSAAAMQADVRARLRALEGGAPASAPTTEPASAGASDVSRKAVAVSMAEHGPESLGAAASDERALDDRPRGRRWGLFAVVAAGATAAYALRAEIGARIADERRAGPAHAAAAPATETDAGDALEVREASSEGPGANTARALAEEPDAHAEASEIPDVADASTDASALDLDAGDDEDDEDEDDGGAPLPPPSDAGVSGGRPAAAPPHAPRAVPRHVVPKPPRKRPHRKTPHRRPR